MTLSNEQWLKIYGVQQEPKTFSAIPQEETVPRTLYGSCCRGWGKLAICSQ